MARQTSKISVKMVLHINRLFVHSDYDFAPVIFETSGALNKEGETVLKNIIRFASKRQIINHTVDPARARAFPTHRQILKAAVFVCQCVTIASISVLFSNASL